MRPQRKPSPRLPSLAKIAPLDYRVVHRIADTLAPEMKRAFLQAVEQLRARLDLTRLKELLARGNNMELDAFWRGFEQEVAPSLRPAIREAFMQTAERSAKTFGIAFDLTNPRAVDRINQQSAELIQGITQESRRAIRAVLARGFTQGLTIDQMAQRIRSSIGLTERYVQAVENYRQGQTNAGVAPATVASRADRYANQLLRLRAETIARTETIDAANSGQQAVWEDAAQRGLLPPDARRQWIITPDDRLCEICEAIPDLNPDGVGLNEPFQTDVGPVMVPPAHVSCRCAIGLLMGEAA